MQNPKALVFEEPQTIRRVGFLGFLLGGAAACKPLPLTKGWQTSTHVFPAAEVRGSWSLVTLVVCIPHFQRT